MRGTILDVDRSARNGILRAEDGRRYEFSGEEWKSQRPPAIGDEVDFEPDGNAGKALYATTPSSQPRATASSIGATSPDIGHVTPNSPAIAALLRDWRALVAIASFLACFLPYQGAGDSINLFMFSWLAGAAFFPAYALCLIPLLAATVLFASVTKRSNKQVALFHGIVSVAMPPVVAIMGFTTGLVPWAIVGLGAVQLAVNFGLLRQLRSESQTHASEVGNMPIVAPFSRIDITERDGKTIFTYERSHYGPRQFITFSVVGLIPSTVLAVMYGGKASNDHSIAILVLSTAIIGFGLPIAANLLSRRIPGTFAFDASKFYVDGREYDRAHVNEVSVTGGSSSRLNQGTVVIVPGGGLTGTAMAGAAVTGQAMREIGQVVFSAYAVISHKIKLRYGEQDVTLADKLSVKRAEAIYYELVKRI